MTNAMSCADYLNTLSKPELCCWVRLNLSYDQIAKVWLAVNRSPMDKDMEGWYLGRCIIRLCIDYTGSNLYSQLAKEGGFGFDYQILLNDAQINQFVLDLIDKAKHQHLASLDLSCLLITSLPEQLFDLTELENLYLAGSLIETLTDNISSLNSLKTLDLYRNNISLISPNIGLLSRLQYLDLDSNQLSSLPSEINKLSDLGYLCLSRNSLNQLPSDFGNLTNLQYLSISHNKIYKLPSKFSNLTNLQELHCSNNALNMWPDNLTNLTSLHSLNLSYNQLKTLPDDPKILLDYEDLLESLEIGNEFIKPKGLKKNILIRPLLDGIERIPTAMNKALKQWQEKKEYLEEQLGIISNPSQKLTLRKQIEECEQEMARLSKQTFISNQGYSQPQNPMKVATTKLSGKELEQLQTALLEAFDLQSIKQMITFKLDKDLNGITTSSGLGNVIFDLITVANKEGWINQLISCAKEYNSGNEHLRVVAESLLNRR